MTAPLRCLRRLPLLLALAAPAAAAPPEPGVCPSVQPPEQASEDFADATSLPIVEGGFVGLDAIWRLALLIPNEVWAHREIFFYEGMRMQIGECHRRYHMPKWWTEATERYAGRAKVDAKGNLEDYVAGVPFPPETLDPDDPQAGVKWAWNLEMRYRGAGPHGQFGIVDMPGRVGRPERYYGTFFLIRTRNRADLASADYELREADDYLWVAGGRFTEPTNARHLAWRQMRPKKALDKYKESDRTYVYVPEMRKSRRSSTAWVDGVFMPRYRVAGMAAGGGSIPIGDGAGVGGMQGIQPTGAQSTTATEHLRRGFVGLSLRPNAYVWEYLGERDVLAPLNTNKIGYPIDRERNWGPAGISPASDRWDLRRAVVIQGTAREIHEGVAQVILYVDWQTQQPLFYIARRQNGLLLDVGILVHRYSGDDPAYPPWPDGTRADVFDPVAATFFSLADGRTGWRRESYDVVSVPVSADEIRSMVSVAELDRGH